MGRRGFAAPPTSGPTPAGVPVKIRSPGARLTSCDRAAMIAGGDQIMSDSRASCRITVYQTAQGRIRKRAGSDRPDDG